VERKRERLRADGALANDPHAQRSAGAQGPVHVGAGQWRRYADRMAEVRLILAPWVEALGYDPDWSGSAP